VDRLLEQGYNSTDIAAALFEMVSGGSGTESKDIPEPVRQAPPEAPTQLRPASRGFQWVELNAGREARITPRDIIGLLEESLGLPIRSVGIIDIQRGRSYAQVPKQFLDVLRDGPRELETNAGALRISLHAEDRPEKEKKWNKKKRG
jgi:ATP-dependent RNA helicase DeaD